MSTQVIPSALGCCDPCVPSGTSGPPGNDGADGATGAAGAIGIGAYTFVANESPDPQPVMPAEGATVTVNVTTSTAFLQANQMVYVGFWGTMKVFGVVSATELTLLNPEVTADGSYADNAAPGTALPAGTRITLTGQQGVAGTTPSTVLLKALNLSDVPVPATARTNLGLGTMAVQNAGTVAITGGSITGITDLAVADGGTGASTAANARTNLGLVIGTNVQAYDADLAAIAALVSAADQLPYFTGAGTAALTTLTVIARTLLSKATTLDMRSFLGVQEGYGIIGRATAVDANTTADTAIVMESANYIIEAVVVTAATLSLTTATAGLFTAAGGAGTTLVADQALSALTASNKYDDLTLAGALATDVYTNATLYFRIGTPQGAAATLDVFIYGRSLA